MGGGRGGERIVEDRRGGEWAKIGRGKGGGGRMEGSDAGVVRGRRGEQGNGEGRGRKG